MFRIFFVFLSLIIFSFTFAIGQERGPIRPPQKVDLQLKVTVPSANYQITLRSLYWNQATNQKIMALILLYEDGVGMQISAERTIEDTVDVPHPGAKGVVYFVLDPQGVLPNSSGYERISVYSEFEKHIQGARCLMTTEHAQYLYGETGILINVTQSEDGDYFTFDMWDPEIMGFYGEKTLVVSAKPGDRSATVSMVEHGVYPEAPSTKLTIVFLEGVRSSKQLRKDRAKQLLGLVSDLQEWASLERAHFLRNGRCRPKLTPDLIRELVALNRLFIKDFLDETIQKEN